MEKLERAPEVVRSLGHTTSEQKLRELGLFVLAKRMLEQLLERMYKGDGSNCSA